MLSHANIPRKVLYNEVVTLTTLNLPSRSSSDPSKEDGGVVTGLRDKNRGEASTMVWGV